MSALYDATFGRAFTVWYGAAMRRIDDRGLREVRRQVLAEAHGRVLDLGSGTGSNLALFPPAVDELVLAEPDPHMLAVLRRRHTEGDRTEAELVQAPAEALPFDQASFDCITCTMVICTMPDPVAGLAEVARVLRPGGSFLFLEHVRSEDPLVARWQDRLERPWRFIADGCHCNRDALALIASSPLRLDWHRQGTMPVAAPFMKPLVYGRATLPTQVGSRAGASG